MTRPSAPDRAMPHPAPEPHVPGAPWMLAAALLAALLTPALARSAPDTPSRSAERYTLSGERVAVYNLAGALVVEPASGSETIVEVTRAGRAAAQLKIATGASEDRASLRVIYPGSRIVYPEMGFGSSTSMHVRDDGTFGGKDRGMWPSGRSVRISGSGGGVEAHADLKVSIPKGADVLLRLATGQVRVSNVDSKLMVDLGSGNVVASDTRGTLGLDTGSGAVRLARAQGPVTIDTGSGDVSVKQVRGGDLRIDTGSGEVDGSDFEVPELVVDTGSGHVALSEVSASSVHIDTGSGGVSLALTHDIDDLKIDAGSGGVEVKVPPETGAMLALETGSGDLDVSLPLTGMHRDHGEMHAQMGDGRGRIVIETGSGGIRIGSR